jgi:cell division inhibitor SulA/protein ImuA
LLLPALITLTSRRDGDDDALKWAALVSPPYIPYAPALARAGIDLTKLLMVHSRREMDTLWAIEQALPASRTAVLDLGRKC